MAGCWQLLGCSRFAGLARPGRICLLAPRFVLIGGAALLATGLPIAATAVADEPASGNSSPAASSTAGDAGLFQRLDANADGAISSDEVPADKQRLLGRLIRAADKDGDGKLTRDEFAAGLKPETAKRLSSENKPEAAEKGVGDRARAGARPDAAAVFRRMDRNGDGSVTKDEVPEERRERFSRLLTAADANGDGALTSDEFAKSFDRARPDRPSADQARSGRPSGAGQSDAESAKTASDEPSGLAAAVLKALDKDGDGQLSADELRSASDSLAALDKNGDGTVTAAELEQRRPQLAALNAAGGTDPARAWQRVVAGDKNGDGKLSEDEVPDRLRRAFSRLDTSGDGQIDESEFKAGLERMRKARGD